MEATEEAEGEWLSTELSNGMVCNKCGYQLGRDAAFCPKCGNRIKSDAKKTSASTILIVVVSVIAAIAVISSIVIVLNYTDSLKERIKSDGGHEESTMPKHIVKVKDEPADEPEEELEDEEAEVEVSEQPAKEDFDFRFGVTGIPENPDYTYFSDKDYAYYCHIPSHFLNDYTTERARFYAPDKTAVMELIAYYNTKNKTPRDIMNERIEAVGGEVTYSASGETWFAVAMRKNGISYYTKGFVDHYIREFTFDFPTEYEVYKGYVEYIEDNFKRTDQERKG